jgi:selenocysteine-specific elongation factor
MLKRRTPVRAHIGSDEIPGTLVFERTAPAKAETVRARLLLSRPTVFYPGSRLIVRRMSPKDLLGGAVALGRIDSAATPSAGRMNSTATRALDVLAASGLVPLQTTQIAAALNVVVDRAQAEIDALVATGEAVVIQKPQSYVSRAAFDAGFERLSLFLEQRHRKAPWTLGAHAPAIAAELAIPEALTVRLLPAWHDDGRIASTGRWWHLPGAAPTLTAQQRAFFVDALRDDPAGPLVPHSYDAVAKHATSTRIEGLAEAIDTLLATGALVRVGDDLYRRAQLQHARTVLATVLKDDGGATMGQLRDAFGTSRKYALPLMEYFDGIGVTIRDGDVRRLRKVAHPKAP